MAAAGEQSGGLDIVLNRLGLHRERQARGKVTSASMYPMLMGGVSVLIVAAFVGVIPRIRRIFDSFGGPAAADSAVLGVSDFIQGYWWLAIIMAAARLRHPQMGPDRRGPADRHRWKITMPLFAG